MKTEEIFSTILTRMIKGLMVHEQFTNYYDFLGLCGYSKDHEKHFDEESKAYRRIYHYYITTYNKLLPTSKFPQPKIIPTSWLQYSRQDVDMKTKQNAVQQGLEEWVRWERETYDLYQQLYSELIKLDKFYDAEEIKCLIYDVKLELVDAEQFQLNKISMNYDMTDIIHEQEQQDNSL